MAKFFINRPIVAMVIAIIMVIVGVVSFLSLPIAQYPNIVPPEIAINATYVGGDALTVEALEVMARASQYWMRFFAPLRMTANYG